MTFPFCIFSVVIQIHSISRRVPHVNQRKIWPQVGVCLFTTVMITTSFLKLFTTIFVYCYNLWLIGFHYVAGNDTNNWKHMITWTSMYSDVPGPLLLTWINFNQVKFSNYIHYAIWEEIIYQFSSFNGEFWEWNGTIISSHILLGTWLLSYFGINVNPCQWNFPCVICFYENKADKSSSNSITAAF